MNPKDFGMLLCLLCAIACVSQGEHYYKGGLHMHSFWSDGDAPPEVYTDWYKEQGWDFICYTDHNILLEGETTKPIAEDTELTPDYVEALREQFGTDWVEEVEHLGRKRMRLKTFSELDARFGEPGKFLLIQGEEITTFAGNPHVIALNVVSRMGGMPQGDITERIQHYMEFTAAQGREHNRPVLSILAHPNWSDGVTVEEALAVEALRFFEVFNGHPGVNNWGHEGQGYPSTDRFWDIQLSLRLRENPDFMLYGVATDDAHNYQAWRVGRANPGRGWVMVRAESLTASALLEAMDRGDFYASTGVLLETITRDHSGVAFKIKVEPDVTYTTRFVGTRKGFNAESEPKRDDAGAALPRASRAYSDEIGVTLAETTDTSPAYAFKGDELYVRAIVVSDKPHPNPFREGDMEMAWVQPVTAR